MLTARVSGEVVECVYKNIKWYLFKDVKDQLCPLLGCQLGAYTSLWQEDLNAVLSYQNNLLINAGVSTHVPTEQQVRSGALSGKVIKADAPALVIWMDAFNIAAGARPEALLRFPSGEVRCFDF